ncbi:hypothetical protein [Natrialba taiwanensis]|uniref:Uncharacterized protein n=1 Tax=Natrialba taiwanensis DSM 12281 TaxID=1230458 RepID=M0AE76_9EURY|nr:hypothetical protein [Natrialba taiwanensis]ELY95638.1 hypothetical protein C484_05115 [Natrialba taiwanensis DSM 12281]
MTTTESESTHTDRSKRNRPQNRTVNQELGEVSHTNPYTGETAGRLFSRGPTVVTDGGEPAATDPESRSRTGSGDDSMDTMRDVSHTPPNDSDDANRVFERGRNADANTDTADGVVGEE